MGASRLGWLSACAWLAWLGAAGCNGDGTPSSGSTSSTTSSASAEPATSAPSATSSAPPAPQYEPFEIPDPDGMPSDLAEQRRAMLRRMRALGAGSDDQLAELEKIIFASKHMGQGNPAAVEHPMTRSECVARRKASGVRDEIQPQCGAPFMTPLYDPARQEPSEASVCIDRYEFPGLPCEYPVTWVSTKEAQKICKTLGKRLCDAHEWEGACAGALRDAEDEYTFGRERKYSRGKHNQDREIRWAYGDKKDHTRCATGSRKSKECGSGWRKCGSNTYPTGSFPECKSPLGVYDQHGNVAEHMSLPLVPKQLGREGGFGEPEMKGSWFVFQQIDAHIDDCRWRAPSWHDNEGTNHANYHLGFRCCKDIPAK